MQVEIDKNDVVVDANLVASLLGVDPAAVHSLLKTQEITCVCERGIEEHEGEYRLSFFYRNRRARVQVDAAGNVKKRSVIDFGDVTLPRKLHRVGR